MRNARNCRNRHKLAFSMVQKEDWYQVPKCFRHVLKLGKDMKFYECPISAIKRQTWDILKLVNDTTDAEGNILHLPFEGTYLNQPDWYRTAVRVVKSERAINQRERINAK